MKKEQEKQELEFKEAYIDSNVFIYSVLDESSTGEKARKILESMKNDAFRGFTCTLTIDEILWAVQKELGKEKAAEISKEFISMQNLEFISVNLDVINGSIDYYKNNLDPRDAIHLSAMLSKNIKTIISFDKDFDKIKSIKRVDFSK